jgi:preprotein translocase subunit SecE
VETEKKKMAKTATIEQGGGSGPKSNANTENDKLQTLKSKTQQLNDFFRDVRAEMRKVTAPSREQVQSTTIVVLITVFAFAFYFWVADAVLRYSLDKFIYRFTHH